jgi:urease accessory protein UreE
MSTVYNPEADRIAEIERLEIDARAMRKRIERAKTDDDKRVLQKLLKETEDRIVAIRARLP